MSWETFVLKLLDEGKEYLKLIAPIAMAWLMPSPMNAWRKRDEDIKK